MIKNKKLGIYLTAGFPTLDSLPQQINQLEEFPIDFIEVGLPFSDPLADGPTIQATSQRALQNGMNTALVFEQLRAVRTAKDLYIMTYFQLVHSFGVERFLDACLSVGVKQLILPDLPLEIYERDYAALFHSIKIGICFMANGDTPTPILEKLNDNPQSAFLYYLTHSSITGNKSWSAESAEKLESLRRSITSLPIYSGFGIHNRPTLEAALSQFDGAIIGSAYLNALADKREMGFLKSIFSELA